MKVSIMQPNIFMWNGLVKQMCDSDLHIILDHTKASKNARYNRNQIAGNSGICWLTIPMQSFSRNKSIQELTLDLTNKNRIKIKNLVKSRYEYSPHFESANKIVCSTIDSFDNCDANLIQVYLEFLCALKKIGVPICKTVRSSEILSENPSIGSYSGVKLVNELLVSVSATTYLASQNTVSYANKDDYLIGDVKIQKFIYQEYCQHQKNMGPRNFVSNLSCIDTLASLPITDYIDYIDNSNLWRNI